jgi:hypothetical protein
VSLTLEELRVALARAETWPLPDFSEYFDNGRELWRGDWRDDGHG